MRDKSDAEQNKKVHFLSPILFESIDNNPKNEREEKTFANIFKRYFASKLFFFGQWKAFALGSLFILDVAT
jgi:hypothetical protein